MSKRTITEDNEKAGEETLLSASGLTAKEEAFCVAFTDVDADSYGNGTESAKKAGYSTASAHNSAWKLRRRPKVQARLDELYEEIAGRRSLTPNRVLSDIEDTRRRAITKGDLATAARCSELMGKTLALFRDCTQFIEPTKQVELNERERLECLALASIRLGASLSLPGDGGEDAAVAMLEGEAETPPDEGLHPPKPPPA
jgi:hypothetical protein